MRIMLQEQEQHLTFDVQPEGTGYRVVIDGHAHQVAVQYAADDLLVLTLDGRRYRLAVARCGAERLVAVSGEAYRFSLDAGGGGSAGHAALAAPEVVAPMPGKVLQVLVQAGDRVVPGDGLVILEAMKMETRIVADASGAVEAVRVRAGDTVDGGQVLIVLRYDR